MNFLELCKRTRSECAISGTGPVTVINQSGELERVVNWVAQAWLEIQEEHPEWGFLRKDVSFNTVAGQNTYTPVQAGVTDFGSWKRDSFRNYLASTGAGGETFMSDMDYDSFRDYYLFNTLRTTQTKPTKLTVAPNKSLILGPVPDAIYTVVGEYFQAPVTLAADADIPSMPTRFHMAIVYKAMMAYGAYSMAPEIYSRGESAYNEILLRLEADQLPQIQMAGALL